jgi:DNA-binding NarL/FixJ family response regulator
VTYSTRVLVVDDYEPWRKYVRSVLTRQPGFEVLGEVSDGLKAVHKAEELQPDLILLDLSLPSMHGIDAARLIRRVAPSSKILFLSENRHPEVAEAALVAGGHGFVVKSDCGHELIVAIAAVLREETFVSQRLNLVPAL